MSKDWPQQKMSDKEMDESMDLVEGKLTQAAANKAAEEGELPALLHKWEAYAFSIELDERNGDLCDALTEIKAAIAADRASRQATGSQELLAELAEAADVFMKGGVAPLRQKIDQAKLLCEGIAEGSASRQVANKAEVDLSMQEVADAIGASNLMRPDEFRRFLNGDDVVMTATQVWKMCRAFATPSATTGVSTGWKKLNDVQWMNIVNHDRAYESYSKDDAVHEAVKRTEAKLEELNAGSVGASTVLTEAQVLFNGEWKPATAEAFYCMTEDKRRVVDVAREVAAQAGQVAVPEGWKLEWDAYTAPGTIRLSSPKWGGAFVGVPKPGSILFQDIIYRLLADMLAAPSPAKESK